MIVIVISMSSTSGQIIFDFVVGFIATLFALVLSFIVWYIVDGKTAAVMSFCTPKISLFYVLDT
mgnify:CR=1 FL=1